MTTTGAIDKSKSVIEMKYFKNPEREVGQEKGKKLGHITKRKKEKTESGKHCV